MNKYETVIIMNSEISQEQKDSILDKVKSYIMENGKVISSKDFGIKKAAYEIKKHLKGHYYIIEFETTADAILELERAYRITDEILKFIILRKDK